MTTQRELEEILKKAGPIMAALPARQEGVKGEPTWIATWLHAKGIVTFDGKEWKFHDSLTQLGEVFPQKGRAEA